MRSARRPTSEAKPAALTSGGPSRAIWIRGGIVRIHQLRGPMSRRNGIQRFYTKERLQLQAGRVVRPQEHWHQGTSIGHSSARRKRSGPSDGDPVRMRGSQGRDSAQVVWSRPSPSVGITRPAEGRGLGTRHALPKPGGLVISSLCAYVMALLDIVRMLRGMPYVSTWPSAAITSVAAGEPGGMGAPGAGLCEVAGIPALLADYVHHH